MIHYAPILTLACLLSACAASRSPLTGTFTRQSEKNYRAEKTTVCFLFGHLTQVHGFDSIPKIQEHGVKYIYNIFRDALPEITNISSYVTFTESPADVNNPQRREELKQLRNTHDYTLQINFFEESSFKQQFLSGTISLLTLTVVPMPYTWNYTISANLYDQRGRLLHSYQRGASLKNWMELFLLFAYPFHPIEVKREAIYAESLHDIFRQIETEKVLKKNEGITNSASQAGGEA
jgi:hypothetical protein